MDRERTRKQGTGLARAAYEGRGLEVALAQVEGHVHALLLRRSRLHDLALCRQLVVGEGEAIVAVGRVVMIDDCSHDSC